MNYDRLAEIFSGASRSELLIEVGARVRSIVESSKKVAPHEICIGHRVKSGDGKAGVVDSSDGDQMHVVFDDGSTGIVDRHNLEGTPNG